MDKEISFDLGQKLGYWIIAFFILSVLFMLLTVFIHGIRTNYYKSNYGESAINVQESIFQCILYEDPVTQTRRERTIDIEKMKNIDLDSCIIRGSVEASIALYQANGTLIIEKNTTHFRREDTTNRMPVLVYENNDLTVGELQTRITNP